MKHIVWILVVLLIVLHQDTWLWDDDSLLLGFLPMGMAYHIGISIAASIVWLLAVRYAWPTDAGDTDGGPVA
jgi:hypothetical protein